MAGICCANRKIDGSERIISKMASEDRLAKVIQKRAIRNVKKRIKLEKKT